MTEVVPDHAGSIDLGELAYSEPKPYVPPTLDEQIATHFGVKGTPLERLGLACNRAKLNEQLVLVQFADPAAQPTRDFMDVRFRDTEVARALDGFRTIAVSIAGELREPAILLTDNLGVTLPTDESQSMFCIVDIHGALIASKSSEEFFADGKVNRESILDFLAEHSIKPFDAQALLNETLARAKAENKRVFLQETATWCGPCWSLSQYLDRTRDVWEKDYIWLKMDHRWTGAIDVMQKIRNGAEGGIPWIAILDSDGKVLATSNDDDGENIGFPSSQLNKSHFRKMINDTKIRLSETEMAQLMTALGSQH
jgi:thiol-disulfide isomerase/thioredoxin